MIPTYRHIRTDAGWYIDVLFAGGYRRVAFVAELPQKMPTVNFVTARESRGG